MATKLCIFNPTTTLIDVVDGIAAATNNISDAGKPVVLNSQGSLDASFLTTTATTISGTASQALNAGDIVNIYYATVNGVPGIYVRQASAANGTNYPAEGYVTTAASTGATVPVYLSGLMTITYVSGFSLSDIGASLYLSNTTPGFVVKTAPVLPDVSQFIGYVYGITTATKTLTVFFNPVSSVAFSRVTGTCAVNQGGTGANLSTTGGAHQVLKQTTLGGPITVGLLVSSDLPLTLVPEVPAGAIPGTSYTLSFTPSFFIGLFLNGAIRNYGTDYTLSGTTITLTNPTVGGDKIYAVYFK